jgi:hypothetical protein
LKQELIDRAATLALEFRKKGFHCSESVFSAINGTLHITDPSMVRIVTGFHGVAPHDKLTLRGIFLSRCFV